MSTRSIESGSYAALEVIDDDDMNALPGGWVGDAEKTSNQLNIDTSETDLTSMTTSPTCTAGRRYLVMAKVRINPDNDPMEIITRLYVNATQLDSDSWRTVVVTEDHRMNMWGVYDCGSTGVKTFKVTAQSLTGGTTFDVNVSSITPGRILVLDVGPTP